MHKQLFNLDITDEQKTDMIGKLGEFDFRMNQGGSEDIQLEALLAYFSCLKK